jgi:hypothetical protein
MEYAFAIDTLRVAGHKERAQSGSSRSDSAVSHGRFGS